MDGKFVNIFFLVGEWVREGMDGMDGRKGVQSDLSRFVFYHFTIIIFGII